ncbi:MAG: hypothetical protein ABI981_09295 [Betaproteobacteria bacterium]
MAFGTAAALAVLSKFSSILFLGVAVLVSVVLWVAHGRPDRIRSRLRIVAESACFAALIGSLIVWAGYRFSFAPVVDTHSTHAPIDQLFGVRGWAHDLAYGLVELPVPAPEFFRGLRDLADQTRQGYPAYLMGETFNHGHWSFFPIGVLVKTPIAFLLLSAFGLAVLGARCWRESRPASCVPVLGVAAIAAVVIPSTINIGMRHVLPIFPLLAIAVGAGIAFLWHRRRSAPTGMAVALILISWLALSSVRAHPDYLAYFNECCDRNPESWLVDSDLDWGQDLDRLASVLKAKRVEHVQLAYFGTADIARHGLPRTTVLRPDDRVHGWVAVSEFRFVMGEEPSRLPWHPPNTEYRWLEAYGPYERVGKSIRLYQVP